VEGKDVKKIGIMVIALALMLVMGLGAIAPQSVSAQEGWGGKNAETVDISWTEHYTMYHPDGTYWWDGSYPVGPIEFKKNPASETYRTTDMWAFMGGGTAPEDILGGFIMVNRTGKLHGEITYISGGGSGATIYQKFWGQVTITGSTMEGVYHDRIYVQQPDGSLVLAAFGDYEVTP
jgi:hypothetical protein